MQTVSTRRPRARTRTTPAHAAHLQQPWPTLLRAGQPQPPQSPRRRPGRNACRVALAPSAAACFAAFAAPFASFRRSRFAFFIALRSAADADASALMRRSSFGVRPCCFACFRAARVRSRSSRARLVLEVLARFCERPRALFTIEYCVTSPSVAPSELTRPRAWRAVLSSVTAVTNSRPSWRVCVFFRVLDSVVSKLTSIDASSRADHAIY